MLLVVTALGAINAFHTHRPIFSPPAAQSDIR
jgi:hypothetical protein